MQDAGKKLKAIAQKHGHKISVPKKKRNKNGAKVTLKL